MVGSSNPRCDPPNRGQDLLRKRRHPGPHPSDFGQAIVIGIDEQAVNAAEGRVGIRHGELRSVGL